MAKTSFPFGAWPPRCWPGWHWPGISSGHRAYRGVGTLANVDFDVPVGFGQADSVSLLLTGLGHAVSTVYTYVVRPVAGNAWLETQDLSCRCEFETDASADWLGSRPTPVEWLDADVIDGGRVRLRWRWRKAYGGDEPHDFGLYYSAGPEVTAGSPQATEPYTREGDYSHTFTLSDGQTYWFAVTARTSEGTESHLSRIIGPYLADAAAPPAPTVTVSTTF